MGLMQGFGPTLVDRKGSRGQQASESGWFSMPSTKLTEGIKHDLIVLSMRNCFSSKSFYKVSCVLGSLHCPFIDAPTVEQLVDSSFLADKRSPANIDPQQKHHNYNWEKSCICRIWLLLPAGGKVSKCHLPHFW